MKIDDAYKATDVFAATQAHSAGKAGNAPKSTERRGAPLAAGSDAVEVSPEARLRAEALKAAAEAPAIRPEAVARGKALLESGRLGSDPAALADRLIASLLDESSKA